MNGGTSLATGPDVSASIEAWPGGAALFDAAGRLRRANREAGEAVGRPSEALAGLSAAEWHALLRERFRAAGRSEEEPFPPLAADAPIRLESRGYPRRILEWERLPLADRDGHPAGCIELLRNVTPAAQREAALERERQRHAREMDLLRTRLKQVEKFELELAANVTHDLKTPIASIKASVSGLLAGDVEYEPQALRETLLVIEEEAERLLRRVNNLLAMARMEAGQDLLSRDWIDLTDVVASALESLRPLRGDRPVRVDLPPDLPLVSGDYDQILNALRNLLENAFLYSPAGSPVEISARASLGQLRLRIRDYGPGLMPDEFERIFEKFYRGRAARRIPGTGLGLPICRAIAESHGGRLWAEHAPGGGVAFVLSLPLEPSPEEETAAETGEQ